MSAGRVTTRESIRRGRRRPVPTVRRRSWPHCRGNRTYVPRLSPPADVLSTGPGKLSTRKHALCAPSSARCPQRLWIASGGGACENERAEQVREPEGTGARQVQSVVAKPRPAAAVRV